MARLDRFNINRYGVVVATIELSDGNESIGNMWTQTKSFLSTTPVSEIIDWAYKERCGGRESRMPAEGC
jgi:hypothetical protein